jgi:hypothetical protein
MTQTDERIQSRFDAANRTFDPPGLEHLIERRRTWERRRVVSRAALSLAVVFATGVGFVELTSVFGGEDRSPGSHNTPSMPPAPQTPAGHLTLGDETRVEGWVTLATAFGVSVAGDGQLFEVDPETGRSRRVATGNWDSDQVGLSDYGEGTIFLTTDSTLLMLDARSGIVIQTLDLSSLGVLHDVLQSRSGSTWVTASSQGAGEALARIDLETGAVLERFRVGQGEVVGAAGYLFTSSDRLDGAGIVRVDPTSGDLTAVPGMASGSIAAIGSHVWGISGEGVTCVDAVALISCGHVPVTRPGLLASDARRLWVLTVTGSRSSTLYLPDPAQPASVVLIDGATGEVLAQPIPLADTTPASLSAFGGHAWVGFHDTGRILRIDS